MTQNSVEICGNFSPKKCPNFPRSIPAIPDPFPHFPSRIPSVSRKNSQVAPPISLHRFYIEKRGTGALNE
jgi:hypothetical protein